VDASCPPESADREIAALVAGKPAILVLNKIDLVGRVHEATAAVLEAPSVTVSALTGQGLEVLEQAIVDTIFAGRVPAGQAPAVTSPRHKEALGRALDHVQAAHAAHCAGQLPDLVAIDLAAAVNTLGEITGQTAGEGLIETIFERFCVGK
jgi:tRNA modification GTPase